MRFTQRVTRQRGTVVPGDYGNDKTDWSDPDEAEFAGEIQPDASSEIVVAGERVVTRWRGFLEPAADFTSGDRAACDGTIYEVEGDPERWRSGGRDHHVELVLEKVTEKVGG